MEWLATSLDWVGNPVVVLRQLMAGLANGMLLFLVASGLTLIFGVTRIINVAHGSFFMLGAYVAFTVLTLTPQSLPFFALAVLAGTFVTFCLGVMFERFCLRRVSLGRTHESGAVRHYGPVRRTARTLGSTPGDASHMGGADTAPVERQMRPVL